MSPPPPHTQLTHIFRDILHGYGQLVMCVNVSPDTCDREESINVLKYASMATHIRMAASTQAKPRVLQCREPSMLGRRVERRAVDTGGGECGWVGGWEGGWGWFCWSGGGWGRCGGG